MAKMPLRWSLSRLTEEASNFTWYIYGMREVLPKKNKRVTFCGSLDHQGASTNLIITLWREGCHPLFMNC